MRCAAFPRSVSRGRRADLLLKDWEEGRDIYLDVVGCFSIAVPIVEVFAPGGAADKTVARTVAVLLQRYYSPFSFVCYGVALA